MPAPPTTFPDAGQYGADHANDGDESYHGEEPSEDDVRDDNPVERKSRGLKMSVESFLCHCILIANNLQCKSTINTQDNSHNKFNFYEIFKKTLFFSINKGGKQFCPLLLFCYVLRLCLLFNRNYFPVNL